LRDRRYSPRVTRRRDHVLDHLPGSLNIPTGWARPFAFRTRASHGQISGFGDRGHPFSRVKPSGRQFFTAQSTGIPEGVPGSHDAYTMVA
jgi:hypothetical protein